MKETEKKQSKLAIVNAIMEHLKLDDQAIVEKFYKKELNRFTSEIKILESNIEQLKLTYKVEKGVINDKIEDAKSDVETAKLSIDVDAIRNNEGINNYKITYWNNIAKKQRYYEQLKQSLIVLKEQYDNDIEAINDDIKELKSAIRMIKELK